MALKPVNPESVRQDLLGLTLWFSEGERNLLIVHDEHGIIFFEYTDTSKVVNGGRGLQLKAGIIGSSHTALSYLRRSRVIESREPATPEFKNTLIKELEACEAMPIHLRQTLTGYLNGDFQNLEFIAPLKNYRPLRQKSALAPLFKVIPSNYRYRISQWMNGWFLPVLGGVIVSCIFGAYIYKVSTKYDPARLCLNTAHYIDCAETVNRALLPSEVPQARPEQALQKLLLFCKDRSQPDACAIVFHYYRIHPDLEWLKKNVVPDCRPKTLSNICSLLNRIYTDAEAKKDRLYSQAMQCQYLRQLVNKKLAVNTLDLNLLHELRDCPNDLPLAMNDLAVAQELCSDWGICAPVYVATIWKKGTSPEEAKRVIASVSHACQTYGDDQCILSACMWASETNTTIFRPDGILFWKDAERDNHVWSKTIPQFYLALTSVEQKNARNVWQRECSAGDIRSCFAYAATSSDHDLPQNVKKFCGRLPEYLKKASSQELIALRLGFKLSGE